MFKYLAIILVSITICSCGEDDDPERVSDCDSSVIINPLRFQNESSDSFMLMDAFIFDDCLEVTLSASGCDGESWSIELVDSGAIMESLPIQRDVKLLFKNDEDCRAVVTQTVSFDLFPLRTDDSSIRINFENLSILYEY